MKRRLLSLVASFLLLCVAATSASAAGFALYEYSARGNALGGALVARADDPSALAFNPAGITQLEGTQVAAGVSAIMPNLDLTRNGDKIHGKNNTWLPPHAYLTHKYNDNVSFGVGVFTRFGLGTEMDKGWAGSGNVYEAVIETYSINPNIAYKFSDHLSVAVGVEYLHVGLDIRRYPNYGAGAFESNLKAEGYGQGITAGVHYKTDNWRFGFGYKNQVEVDASGDQTFSSNPHGFKDVHAEGTVVLPDMINFGVAWYPTEDLSVEVGAVQTRWSTYNALTFRFSESLPLGVGTVSTTTKDWRDVWRYNIGIEYALTDQVDLRCGYIYDESPLNPSNLDYLVPANDRQLYSVGAGYKLDNWTFDLSYTYLWMKGQEYNNTATGAGNSVHRNSQVDNARTDIFGLTVGYKF